MNFSYLKILTKKASVPASRPCSQLIKSILAEQLPKYIWISTLLANNKEVIYFIYDATALRHSDCLLFAFSNYYKNFWPTLIERLGTINNNPDDAAELSRILRTSIKKFSEKVIKLIKFLLVSTFEFSKSEFLILSLKDSL